MRMLLAIFTALLCAVPITAHTQSHTPAALVEEYRFGDFTDAEALSVDQFNNVYIVDGSTALVQKFDMRGSRLAEVGGPGWDDTQFDRPTGIDARLGIAVYVADYGNNRVSRFDRGLRFMASLSGEDDASDPGFGYPLDVANSSLEQLFVLDGENNRVLALNNLRSVSRVFGGIEAGEGRLTEPVALAADENKHLYVLESHRVVVFDLFGNFLFHFGSDQFTDAQGITVTKNGILVVTPDTLHFYSARGELRRSIAKEQMVLAGACGEFRDAAYTLPFLLILTQQTCILFPNN
ncbi:NHL repeat-containing protein [bacterium]|nr:NHL repeat-containing protein [bacterium]